MVFTPVEGWRLVHDRDLAAGADPESLEFISCLQPAEVTLIVAGACDEGVEVWTGFEGPGPEIDFEDEARLMPDLGVALVYDQRVAEADLIRVEETLRADPQSPGLTSRKLDGVGMDDGILMGGIVRYSFADNGYVPTGESLSLTVSAMTLCTEFVVPEAVDRPIRCTELAARLSASGELPFSVVYEDDLTAWRISEDLGRIGLTPSSE